MKLLFKQRLFAWFDSYDIYYEDGSVAYTVKGQLSWGHKLNIYNRNGDYVGTVKERIIKVLPAFDIYIGENHLGTIRKDLSLLSHRYNIDYKGWSVKGNFLGWDYEVIDANKDLVAVVSKALLRITDTYVIDVLDGYDEVAVLMLVLAIDAEKCSASE